MTCKHTPLRLSFYFQGNSDKSPTLFLLMTLRRRRPKRKTPDIFMYLSHAKPIVFKIFIDNVTLDGACHKNYTMYLI